MLVWLAFRYLSVVLFCIPCGWERNEQVVYHHNNIQCITRSHRCETNSIVKQDLHTKTYTENFQLCWSVTGLYNIHFKAAVKLITSIVVDQSLCGSDYERPIHYYHIRMLVLQVQRLKWPTCVVTASSRFQL